MICLTGYNPQQKSLIFRYHTKKGAKKRSGVAYEHNVVMESDSAVTAIVAACEKVDILSHCFTAGQTDWKLCGELKEVYEGNSKSGKKLSRNEWKQIIIHAIDNDGRDGNSIGIVQIIFTHFPHYAQRITELLRG